MAQTKLGYDDTPFISGNPYRVHGVARPQPRVITPGTARTQNAPGAPPSDAVVLFDGTSLDAWQKLDGNPAVWALSGDFMEVVPKTGNIRTKTEFGDCQLHLEWAAPGEVKGDSQGRGNSGVFMMGKYEIQVLDCYDNPTYADGSAGALYGQCPPLVNACRKPGEWQVYDIVWTAPRFEGDSVLKPACATVFLNGVLLHHAKELIGPTEHRVTTKYTPHPTTGPLMLQDHGDLVRFRNIWYRPLVGYDQ